MGPTDRIDSYAKQAGWTPDMLPIPPPEMTPRQIRRFMHKLQCHKRHPHEPGTRCRSCRTPADGS